MAKANLENSLSFIWRGPLRRGLLRSMLEAEADDSFFNHEVTKNSLEFRTSTAHSV